MPKELVPLAVRIALRNAVGGWGPYTVREIADLFNARGFTVRNSNVQDAGGMRRTEAEAYQTVIDFASPDQARRYLELVDEVLENYPEDDAEPAKEGERLRKELRRAGITRGPSGRLELPRAAQEAAKNLDEATAGVWTANRIRVFLSHTSQNRVAAAELAKELNRFAFSCFVAHEVIEPSRDWQEVIELALRTTDILVAYVTPDFSSSRWTDQEVGWALGRELIVIPVKVGADPYGFFGAYQAVTVQPTQQAKEIAVALTRAIAIAVFRGQRRGAGQLVDRMTSVVVEAFCRSATVDAARRRYQLLIQVPRSAWQEGHVQQLRRVAAESDLLRTCALEPDRPSETVADAVMALVGAVPEDRAS